jgi:hypothetical protein
MKFDNVTKLVRKSGYLGGKRWGVSRFGLRPIVRFYGILSRFPSLTVEVRSRPW